MIFCSSGLHVAPALTMRKAPSDVLKQPTIFVKPFAASAAGAVARRVVTVVAITATERAALTPREASRRVVTRAP